MLVTQREGMIIKIREKAGLYHGYFPAKEKRS
jgi:hypothetical protein